MASQPETHWVRPVAAFLLVVQPLAASDITLDAVTRATVLNPSIGDPAALTDRRTPDLDPDAAAFEWIGLGLLAVAWPEPVQVATLRVYLGTMGRYSVLGFVGGSYNQTGQRRDVVEPIYSSDGIVAAAKSGWYEIPLPTDRLIDNLGFQVVDGAVFYEVEYLTPEGTAIAASSFGAIKRLFSDSRDSKGKPALAEQSLHPFPR